MWHLGIWVTFGNIWATFLLQYLVTLMSIDGASLDEITHNC